MPKSKSEAAEILKKQLEEATQKAEFEKQQKANQDLLALKRAKSVKYIQELNTVNIDGKDEDVWARIRYNASKAASPHQVMSFEDWRAATSSMFADFCLLSKGLHAWTREAMYSARNEASDKFTTFKASIGLGPAATDMNVVLPKMLGLVSVDGGKITIGKLTAKDTGSISISDPMNKLFEDIVINWLDQNGYKVELDTNSPNYMTVKDSSGKALTQADLKDLEVNGNPTLVEMMDVNIQLSDQQTISPK